MIGRSPPAAAILLSLLFAVLAGCAPGLQTRSPAAAPHALTGALQPLLADTALEHAHWGLLVRSLSTGETLFSHNGDRLFVPASNMKLITGATVLETLGADYRYRTEISGAGPVSQGVLRGPLVVRGFGDPTISERFSADPLDRFRMFADSLRARGISRVTGGIIGVDSAFVDGPLGAGWAWDDVISSYASEFGALQFNEGAVSLTVVPSQRTGEAAVVILNPAIQYVSVTNQTVTTTAGAPTRINVARDATGPGLIVTGQIGAGSDFFRRDVSIRNPTLFYLSAMRETLREAGVIIEGPVMDADDLDAEDQSVRRSTPLFTYRSPPLREVLPGMMKPSQNWIAETMLRSAGLEQRGEGSARAGAAVADSLFDAWRLPPNRRIADGSGLSRYNLMSPALVTGLLIRMANSAEREVWEASLPIAGVDGTLARRMVGTPLQGNVQAKTGTLSGVRALSGYLTTRSGERVVFSAMVNNHVRSAAAADLIIDAVLLQIYEMR
ncbi:D-alanyl-D-alanine carboxypeptidase/D-alanyl-D-alanine-endopeptidase [soil metagenome]